MSTIIPLFTEEELARIEWFKASSPGIQKQILEVIECVANKGETEKVRKEARKMLKVMRGGVVNLTRSETLP